MADQRNYEQYLLKSISTNEQLVKSRVYLAEVSTKKPATELYEQAVSNIVKVYSEKELGQITIQEMADPHAFINEHILGTHISYLNYELLHNALKKVKKAK